MPASPDGLITLHVQDGIAVLTFDRQERRNALHAPMWEALGARCEELAARVGTDGLRAVILTGAGGHFSAGMDLKADNPLVAQIMPAIVHADHEAARDVIRGLKRVTRRLRDLPVPTIAAIEGVAAGGGYEIALHCDIIVAAQDAQVGLPEVRVGMVPDVGGTTLLTRRVGIGRAALAITTGRMFPAPDALTLGMVDVVCAPGGALAEAHGIARDIALGGPESVHWALRLLRRVPDLHLDEALDIETEAGVAALTSGEPREGTLAFASRRDPDWSRRG